jgi:hypothetical protein
VILIYKSGVFISSFITGDVQNSQLYTSSLCIVSALRIMTVYGCMMANITFCLTIKIF